MVEALTRLNVVAWTDGACLGNPGPGGYGVVLIFQDNRKELSGGFARTTNNRMELLAAIMALETLKQPCKVTLHSDSKYVVDAMRQGWARKWRDQGWMRNRKDPAINPDLWERLLNVARTQDVDFVWVRGHSGIPENERADVLAGTAAQLGSLPPDSGYRG